MPEPVRPAPRRAMIGRPGPLTIGIDIGGTKVLGGVVDAFGTILTSRRGATSGTPIQRP